MHRVLNLWEGIALLERKKLDKDKREFHAKITDDVFILKLAYLVDFFREINTLNLILACKKYDE